MIPSEYEGKNIGYVDGQEIMIRELRKLQDVPHLIEAYERKMEEITNYCGSSPGACGEMSTGNTLALRASASSS
jgi:IMP cyclohydrolase